ncbi:Histidine protein kinase divJ [Actinomyces bovis]|uniref:Sensor-like histidine kinase SenX3 n=1 Tax=Actinomyces bovis TaxID=1658 RepID=A0ABY1VTJ1_9ACTO|nr:HAMP domain-containing sensor histidine kinase [Actinomyces bovis]SPT54343.1 Histidine protein kinase divJ [Actinomyces bovis]VEG56257.1 Histidine protein kinase divJ [Actinomyces israelii]
MSPAATLALAVALALAGIATAAALLQHRRANIARAEAERLRAQARERATPRDVLAHEIRTPLSLIRGSAELLAEETPGDLNQVQQRFVTTIIDNCEQAIGMAEDFLTQARLDHELFSLHLARVELRSLVRTLVQEMRRSTRTQIRLDDHGAPIRITADARLLRQAIANTVTNSVRHAGTDATVTVSVTAADSTALVTISDDGAGMTLEQKRALFTPYSSTNALDAPASKGVGLGMVITRQVLALHGGEVLIDTISARGTTIYLSLPTHGPTAAAPPPATPPSPPLTTSPAPPSALKRGQ